MVAFLVEAYCGAEDLAADRRCLDDFAMANGDPVVDRPFVRLVHAVYVPEDETCFYLFEAASIEAVQEAARRAGLRFERLSEAVSAWPTPIAELSPQPEIDPLADEDFADSRTTTRARRFASAP